jgi:hypothetical protein
MRWLLNVLAVLSLAAAAMAAALWARSYGGSDYLERMSPGISTIHTVSHRIHGVRWTLGQIRFRRSDYTAYLPPDLPAPMTPSRAMWGRGRLGPGHWGQEVVTGRSLWNRMGFCLYETGTGASFYDEIERGATIPAWLPVLVFLALPLVRGLRLYRSCRRHGPGLCRSCGYDLRATPGRCPECGLEAGGAACLNE